MTCACRAAAERKSKLVTPWLYPTRRGYIVRVRSLVTTAAVAAAPAAPAQATKAPFLVSGRLVGAPTGTVVFVSVDVLGESGRIPILASDRVDARRQRADARRRPPARAVVPRLSFAES